MIRFQCECGRTLQARPEDVGMQSKCPACGKVQPVPAESAAFTESPPLAPAADRGRDRDDDRGERGRDDYRERDRDDRRGRDREDDRDDRGGRRRRDDGPEGTSGKATAALIFGLSSLCLGLPALVGLPLAILAMRDIGKSRGRLGGQGLAVGGLICSILGLLVLASGALMLPAIQKVREAASRMKEQNNLKQVGLALQSLHDTNNSMPAATAYKSRDGKSGLSWRIAILPYMEQDNLHKLFKLDEAWDSPHNIQLLKNMPMQYQQPGRETTDGTTYYQAIVGPGAAFEESKALGGELPPGPFQLPRKGMRFTDFADGTSNTILIGVSDKAVPWTKPDDMTYDPSGSLPTFSKRFSGGFNVLMADGSVRFLSVKEPEQTLRARITRAQNDTVID